MKPAATANSRALQYLLFSVALIPFYLLPLWAGIFAGEYGFEGTQLGILLSADMALGTLASLCARTWILRWRWKPILVAAILVATAANLGSMIVSDFTGLLLLRGLAGFAAGSMMAFPYASLASFDNPDREYSLALALQVCLGAAALLLVGQFDADGQHGLGFILCAAFAFLPIFLVTKCPPVNPATIIETGQSIKIQTPPAFLILALTTVCLFFTALTAIWVFMERLGSEIGMANSLVASILALGLLFSFAGAITPSLAISFLRRHTLIILAYCCLLASIAGTGLASLAVIYAVSIIVYNFFYSFVIPLQTAWIAETDGSGRNAVLIPVAQGIGVTAGPILAATANNHWQGTGVIFCSLLLLLGSLACYLLAAGKTENFSG